MHSAVRKKPLRVRAEKLLFFSSSAPDTLAINSIAGLSGMQRQGRGGHPGLGSSTQLDSIGREGVEGEEGTERPSKTMLFYHYYIFTCLFITAVMLSGSHFREDWYIDQGIELVNGRACFTNPQQFDSII